MPNPLSRGLGTPPPPDIQDSPLGQGQIPQAAPGPVSGQGAGAPPQSPAPTHQQTVAALRHFDAIERELSSLLADPDIGKANIRSKIIDGAAKLIAQGIISPAQAVAQLGSVPAKPFDQKKWVETNFAQTIQSANNVLDHHRAAFPGMPAPAAQPEQGNADNHLDVISGLMDHYNGLKNAG